MNISRRNARCSLLVATICLLLAACGLTDDTPAYRYRLTVEVDTPEGVKVGSSVIEVDTHVAGEYSIPTPGRVTHRVRGEAVAVDLGEGRVLFALLRSEGDTDWAGRVMYRLSPQYTGKNGLRDAYRNMLRHRPERTVPRYFSRRDRMDRRLAYPMLVTFSDLDEPTSVERVDPDDLAATFGEGVSLKRITVQITDDPVTGGIEERLRWMDQYRKMHFDGTSTVSEDLTTDSLAAHFTAGTFSTEFAR